MRLNPQPWGVKVPLTWCFFKEYSLVAEQRSSKSYVWVRFLLLLLHYNFFFKKNKLSDLLIKNLKKNKKFKNKKFKNKKFVNFDFQNKNPQSLAPFGDYNYFKFLIKNFSVLNLLQTKIARFTSNNNLFLIYNHKINFFFFSNFVIYLNFLNFTKYLKVSLNTNFYKFFYLNNHSFALKSNFIFKNLKIKLSGSSALFPTLFKNTKCGDLIAVGTSPAPVNDTKLCNLFNFYKKNNDRLLFCKTINKLPSFELNFKKYSKILIVNSNFLKYFKFAKFIFELNKAADANFKKSKLTVFQLTENDFLRVDFIRLTKSAKFLQKFEIFKNFNCFKLHKIKLIKLLNTVSNFEFDNKIFLLKYNKNFDQNPISPVSTFSHDDENRKNLKSVSTGNWAFFDKFSNNASCANPSFIQILLYFQIPIFFKYLNYLLNRKNFRGASLLIFFKEIFNNFNLKYFMNNKKTGAITNVLPNLNFVFSFKKKIIKTFSYQKFNFAVTPWYNNSLLRFLEFVSGKKVLIKIYGFLNNVLSFEERAHCLLWAQKLKNFKKILGPNLYLTESLEIIYISLKLKDSVFLLNWMLNTMQKISFWKYRLFFRYLKYILRYFFSSVFRDLAIKGLKFQLKGKISVAGNARTRTILQTIGQTSHSTYNNKVLYELGLVRTFTGVLGLKVWIFF